MKHLLTIQKNTPGNDLDGENAESWEDVEDIYCEVKPLTGREYIQAQQSQSQVSHKIRTRYRPNMNNLMRLVKRVVSESDDPETAAPREYSRIFNVDSVVNVDERNRELEWMCVEVTQWLES